MKIKYVFIWVFLFISFALNAQLNDDFSDDDFTQNPTWLGETAKFKVNSSQQLQLQNTGVDTAYLSTASSLSLNAEWTFWAKQSFNSSDNNHTRIYLMSSESDLSDSLRGYFVQFGSSDDNISLFRQDGEDTTMILKGSIHSTSSSVNSYRFMIKRDVSGQWDLAADASGGTNFVSEGTVLDNTYLSSSYFGVFCKHTSSNSTKIYFDDFQAGIIQIDSVPPSLTSVKLIDQQHLELQFSETLDPTSAENVMNYSVNNSVGNPLTASLFPTNASLVVLSFQQVFPLGVVMELTAQSIGDLKGNISGSYTVPFAYYQTQSYDVLINEIMADPTPEVGLPNAEYIELYNKSDFPIDLENWILTVGSSTKTLPSYTLASHAYVLLADDANTTLLKPFADVIEFSTFSLSNSGSELILIDNLANVIDHKTYELSWYGNTIKENGGWSLEMMDIENPCACETNWSASVDVTGGTPGRENSVAKSNPDLWDPEMVRVSVSNSVLIQVYFSEYMDSTTVLDESYYTIQPSIGNIVSVKGNSPTYNTVQLQFGQPMRAGVVYTLSATGLLNDCVGNTIDDSKVVKFGLPEFPVLGDVIINELLFDPQSDGVDFVELYNHSDKIIDLRFLALANWDDELMMPGDLEQLSEEGWLFMPHTYAVLSTDASKVQKYYLYMDKSSFVDMSGFISMSNDQGSVLLVSTSGEVFDRVDYTDEMHYDLLIDTEGISLERIYFDKESNNPDNWHSAAESVGFATPGYLNSQSSLYEVSTDNVHIEPAVFSPDNDGRDDVVSIQLNLGESAQSCTIRIYDSRGRLVRNLKTNAYVSQKSVFTWDGINEDNKKAGLGIYVIYIEVYDSQGSTKQFKEVVTLGGRL